MNEFVYDELVYVFSREFSQRQYFIVLYFQYYETVCVSKEAQPIFYREIIPPALDDIYIYILLVFIEEKNCTALYLSYKFFQTMLNSNFHFLQTTH